MNFLSNVLDSIPVVGHVKGIVHYAVGDDEGGHKAMYQSTRTTAVLGGGAVGCLAGPAGAVAGAMYAGLATDGIASIAMDKPQGIIQGCESIGKDISAGKNPTGSILSTGLQLGLDGVGGLGMGGISSAASQVSEKAVAKTIENVGKKAISTVGEEVIEKTVQLTGHEMAKLMGKKVSEKAVKKAIETAVIQTEVALVTAHIGVTASQRTEQERKKKEEEERKERERQRRQKQERERKEKEEREKREKEEKEKKEKEEKLPSGNDPKKNKNNKNKQKNKPDYLTIFKKLLKRLLQLIYGNNVNEPISCIFDGLNEGQINHFIGIIEGTMNKGILDEVTELVIRLFKGHEPFSSNISYDNFLSVFEFVRAYLLANIDRIETESTQYDSGTHEQRQALILRDIMSQRDLVEQMARLFRSLQAEIEKETKAPNNILPDFRNIFAAVYHYFKHKDVPGDGELTVKDYYDWIRKILKKLKQNRRYQREVENQRGPVTCKYDVYVSIMGRRFRIVVKVKYNPKNRLSSMVLSSAFFVKMEYLGDAEGDEVIIILKK